MKFEVKCPYCKNPITTEVDTEDTPIRGSFTEDCKHCGAEVDVLRIALFALERESTTK